MSFTIPKPFLNLHLPPFLLLRLEAILPRRIPRILSVASSAREKMRSTISSILNGSCKRLREGLSVEKISTNTAEEIKIQESDTFQKKVKARERKSKWFAKHCHIDRVIAMSSMALGSKAIEVLEKLGREAKENEYISLIHLSLEEAKRSDSESNKKECIDTIYNNVKSMAEKGFSLKEDTYGPILLFMIENKMPIEFQKLCILLDDDDRLGYYNLRLHLHLNDEENVNNLCKCVTAEDYSIALRENYLLAVCETDRRDTLLTLLKGFDVTLVSSLDHLISIFRALGSFNLERIVQDLLSSIKGSCYESYISTVIGEYATSISNLSAEEKVSKWEDLHQLLDLKPTFESYDVIVNHCCNISKVHLALHIAEKMNEDAIFMSSNMVIRISRACDEGFEFPLVKRLYSLICKQGLKLDTDIFTWLITLCVKMKDFDGALRMVDELKKMGLKPYSRIYNVIMGGYFREKDISGALNVLNQMESEGIEPDSSTYSYLIGNCDTEEKLLQFYEKMKSSGVKQVKQVFMARISAYVSCGLYEKANQVLHEEGIPVANLNEIKSKLIEALSYNGQSYDALLVYREMKTTGCSVDPKSIISLIESISPVGKWKILVELLDDLKTFEDSFWIDGSYRVIRHCVVRNNFKLMIRILEQLVEKLRCNEIALEYIFDEVFSEIAELEPADVNMGLKLLRKIKSGFKLSPSRKCLDFMMQTCVNGKNLKETLLVWKEYKTACLPYNVLSYLRMYQALLASGSVKKAMKFRREIPRDDFHVCLVLSAFTKVYGIVQNDDTCRLI